MYALELSSYSGNSVGYSRGGIARKTGSYHRWRSRIKFGLGAPFDTPWLSVYYGSRGTMFEQRETEL